MMIAAKIITAVLGNAMIDTCNLRTDYHDMMGSHGLADHTAVGIDNAVPILASHDRGLTSEDLAEAHSNDIRCLDQSGVRIELAQERPHLQPVRRSQLTHALPPTASPASLHRTSPAAVALVMRTVQLVHRVRSVIPRCIDLPRVTVVFVRIIAPIAAAIAGVTPMATSLILRVTPNRRRAIPLSST